MIVDLLMVVHLPAFVWKMITFKLLLRQALNYNAYVALNEWATAHSIISILEYIVDRLWYYFTNSSMDVLLNCANCTSFWNQSTVYTVWALRKNPLILM